MPRSSLFRNSFSLSIHFPSLIRNLQHIAIQSNISLNPSYSRIYDDLLHFCFQKSKELATRHPFDEMPRISPDVSKASKLIHSRSILYGFCTKGALANAIMDLYCKQGDELLAAKVFDRLEVQSIDACNSILTLNSKLGNTKAMLLLFHSLRSSGTEINQFTCAVLISSCSKAKNILEGRKYHSIALKMGFERSTHCQGALVAMYAKNSQLRDAQQVLKCSSKLSNAAWTSIIAGFSRAGLPHESLKVYEHMQKVNHEPDEVGKIAVMNNYAKLGKLEKAIEIFSRISKQNVVAWNVLISSHAQRGFAFEAMKFYEEMRKFGTKPTRSTYGSILSAIASESALRNGVVVHGEAIKLGLHSNAYVGSSLINMYAKCDSMRAAKEAFLDMNERDIVAMNAIMAGYAQNGESREVIEWFSEMKGSHLLPDVFTFTSILSACAGAKLVDGGLQLHGMIIKMREDSNLFVSNALIDLYAKCGKLENARAIFERMKIRDNVSWNAIIVGYSKEVDEFEAFQMFNRMISLGFSPDEFSVSSILSACGIDHGKQIHSLSLKHGFESTLYVGSSLVSMYAKCGDIESADEIFSSMPHKNSAPINSMISAYSAIDFGKAVQLYKEMVRNLTSPCEITFSFLLDSCDPRVGVQLHCAILKYGMRYEDEFLGSSLLGMYFTFHITDAIALFSHLPNPKTTVLWTRAISGFVQCNSGEEAFQYYREMSKYGVSPDQATFVSVLKASSMMSSPKCGTQIHAVIFFTAYDSDEPTLGALVDFYAKCGDISSSRRVFEEMGEKHKVSTWNSMIVGYAKNGFAEEAVKVFDEMLESDVAPDDVSFLGALTACSHGGHVAEGRRIFGEMVGKFGMKANAEHLACVVDLLGRRGLLSEAEDLIESVGVDCGEKAWSTMLGACAVHGDEGRGHVAAERLIGLGPDSSAPFVLMSNIYAGSENWEEVKSLRREMRERGIRKEPGFSWIDVGGPIVGFVAGQKFHYVLNGVISGILNYSKGFMCHSLLYNSYTI